MMKTIRAEVRVTGDVEVEVEVPDDATDRQIQDALESKAVEESGLCVIDCEVEWYNEVSTAAVANVELEQALADIQIQTLSTEQQEQFVKVCRLTIDALKRLATSVPS